MPLYERKIPGTDLGGKDKCAIPLLASAVNGGSVHYLGHEIALITGPGGWGARIDSLNVELMLFVSAEAAFDEAVRFVDQVNDSDETIPH